MTVEHFPHRSTQTDVDDLVRHALREGYEVKIQHAERTGFDLVIDGVRFPGARDGFPWESFMFPLSDITVGDEAEPLVEELRESYLAWQTERRNARASTGEHAAAEGAEDV